MTSDQQASMTKYSYLVFELEPVLAVRFKNLQSRICTLQGQKFVAVLKAKNRGAATSQNVKNRGIVAAKIVKIAAMSRQKS